MRPLAVTSARPPVVFIVRGSHGAASRARLRSEYDLRRCFVPAKTPAAVLRRLNEDSVKSLKQTPI